jgi:hypothetical protein
LVENKLIKPPASSVAGMQPLEHIKPLQLVENKLIKPIEHVNIAYQSESQTTYKPITSRNPTTSHDNIQSNNNYFAYAITGIILFMVLS